MGRLLSVLMLLALLTACAAPAAPEKDTPLPPEPEAQEASLPPPAPPEPEPYEISDPTVEQEGFVPWTGTVEHLFFHPVIAYPELAFDGDGQANGLAIIMDKNGKVTKAGKDMTLKGHLMD